MAREIGASSTDRCVVLTGAGGAFCSGADLSDGGNTGGPRHQLAAMRHINSVIQAFHDLPQPTIAKVTGVAAGVGCSLALGCDLVVASEEARFSLIFAKRGLSLDGAASWLLPRLVGLHKAKELALFADVIGAQEALELGIVNRVLPARRGRRPRRRVVDAARRRAADRAGDDQAHAQPLVRAELRAGARRRGPRRRRSTSARRTPSRRSPRSCRSAIRSSAGR